jgi:penicillin V acylase-like amidase (Ntn superfamily)
MYLQVLLCHSFNKHIHSRHCFFQTMSMLLVLIFLAVSATVVRGCTDFYMNFTDHRLSGRNMDLGTYSNWTLTTWPKMNIHSSPEELTQQIKEQQPPLAYWPARYGSVGISGNWLGDDKHLFPSFFADSLNEKGLSCSFLMLLNTQYQKRDDTKDNVFAGLFCHYVAQTYTNVLDLQAALPTIAIYGPDVLAQHFIVRDASGKSLVIECLNGEQHVYLDLNDGLTGFGVTTNEPAFDWHLENIQHYEWKRTLARQAVAIPGNFYPEERFLRAHMIKAGMQQEGLFQAGAVSYQVAVSLTAQVLNSVNVPEGMQYGTDSGDSGASEGSEDHTTWAIIRNHVEPALYW